MEVQKKNSQARYLPIDLISRICRHLSSNLSLDYGHSEHAYNLYIKYTDYVEYRYINNNLNEDLINSVAYINLSQLTLKKRWTKPKPINYIKSKRLYEQYSVSLAIREANKNPQ